MLLVPFDLRLANQLNELPVMEIGDQHPSMVMGVEIAQRIEEVITGVVGDAQRGLIEDMNKPGIAATMRHIRPGVRVCGGDEEGIGQA